MSMKISSDTIGESNPRPSGLQRSASTNCAASSVPQTMSYITCIVRGILTRYCKVSRLTKTQHLIYCSVWRMIELPREATYFECVIQELSAVIQCETIFHYMCCTKLCVVLYIVISNISDFVKNTKLSVCICLLYRFGQ